MIKFARFLTVVTFALVCTGLRAQEPAPMAEGSVHLVKEGETLAAIAKQHLGDEAAAAELAAFNSLAADAALKAGDPVVLPGPERAQAVNAIEQARLAMQKAVDAQSGEFSMEEFKRAVTLLESASQSRVSAIYPRAFAVAKMAENEFLNSIRVAGLKAQESKPAKIESAGGKVEIRAADGKDYAPVKSGAEAPAGTVLRTSADSRAVLALPDGSRIALQPGAELQLATLNVDRRDGTTTSRLALLAGELTGRTPAAKTKNSSLVITNGTLSVSGPDAEFRLNRLEDGSAQVLAIRNALRIESEGRVMELAAGAGVLANAAGAVKGPFNAPGPAAWTQPEAPSLTTAKQVLDLAWRLNGAPEGTVSAFELARDEAFVNIVEQKKLDAGKVRVGPLADGVYFARVSGVAGGWLAGVSSPVLRIEVKTNLAVAFSADKEAVRKNGKRVVGLNAAVAATPGAGDTSVVAVEYSIDGGAFQKSEGGVSFDKVGEFKLTARGVAADGKTGEAATETVIVDGAAPEVRVHIGEVMDFPGYGLVRSVSVLVDDEIKLGKVEVALNDGDYKKYDSPLKLPVGKDHRVRVRAFDAFGNQAETAFLLEKIAGKSAAEPEAAPEKAKPAPEKRRGWF